MKRFAAIALALVVLWPTLAQTRKTTYIATNHRFNYVKLKEVKSKVAAERNMTHPVQIDGEGMRVALKSIKLSRSFLIKKEVDTQDVFDEWAIDFLAPNLAKAFAQANSKEEVVFSYLSKNPRFILRNDRLNLGRMWIDGNELHIKFGKLYAKVTGDVDKRGNEAKAIARSRGLRVNLELGPGQHLAMEDHKELVLNLHHNYAVIPDAAMPLPTTTRTMAGETVPVPGVGDVTAADAATTTKSGKTIASNSTPTAADAPPTMAVPANGGLKARLKLLEELKKEGMITNQEYKTKKTEILKDL